MAWPAGSACRRPCGRSIGGEWLALLLTKDGAPRKPGGFCKSKWAKSDPALAAACVGGGGTCRRRGG